MVFSLPVIIVILSIIKAAPATQHTVRSCKARYTEYECSLSISSPSLLNCKETQFNLIETETSKVCTSAQLFWNYPVNNLTITITTPFTSKKQAYTVSIDNEELQVAVFHVYRILNGQETEVTTNDTTLVQDSDANYQVILKFQGPPTLTYYGVFIRYTAIVKG